MNGQVRKGFRVGTHRQVCPEETLARVSRFMPHMGITRIANVTGLDRIGVPVTMVCRPNSRSLSVSQGKGINLAAAKASGLMESVEAFHAERIQLPLKLCSYEELRYKQRVVDVEQLSQPSDGLFHPDHPMLWVEGHDLVQDEPVWAPFEVVHTDFATAQLAGPAFFIASSDGLASGNHMTEAISHGICELIERDASALWSLSGQARQNETRIDVQSVEDADCRTVLEKFDRADVAVTVWETTSDVGIPAFFCAIADRVDSPIHRMPAAVGLGCHPARPIALLRALTEAAQGRLTAISGSRDDMGRRSYERQLDSDQLREHPARSHQTNGLRPFKGPSGDGETFEEDIAWELDRLQAAGIQRVVIVDLTRSEFKIPVVRVVIPGLEFFSLAGGQRYGARARHVMEQSA